MSDANLPAHLTALETSGLIRRLQVQPEIEYLFRHALVQEATYASLLRQDRKQLHRSVGEAIASASTRIAWTSWPPCWPGITMKQRTARAP
jgi:predicted ATPase